ncbi:TIGR03750 family conjugal transfer protein [Aquisalimonas lutea]|uniref:TIGR03750 family conjugal transfer protein n=1 Tax=Aquisalimonas lutea TaxID=1327750 RepID=UPI0025B34BFC|nr:TIGR03750 family conjugal transfer protein [Aquisalimonas lutea]MDN3519011.1 TIGR03750 family conjugal transfer protein [Aquisalimonas lutea]
MAGAELPPPTERLNEEPAIFRGCSSSELVGILVGAIGFWLPTLVLVGFAVGYPMVGVGGAAAATLATVFVAATVFQRIKRGRPIGYYQQLAILVLHRARIRRAPIVLRSGPWDLGRRV